MELLKNYIEAKQKLCTAFGVSDGDVELFHDLTEYEWCLGPMGKIFWSMDIDKAGQGGDYFSDEIFEVGLEVPDYTLIRIGGGEALIFDDSKRTSSRFDL